MGATAMREAAETTLSGSTGQRAKGKHFIPGSSEDSGPYNFAIEEMLLHHDGIDSPWVLEGQETEAAGAASCTIAHDGTFLDLAKLREVIV
jgi:hypothetical protein